MYTFLVITIFGCEEKNQEETQAGDALKIVDEFYDSTNNRKDVKAAAMLITEDISFVGPLMQTSGAKERVNRHRENPNVRRAFPTFHYGGKNYGKGRSL